MNKSWRSAWCKKAELSDPADSDTTKEAPPWKYVLHRFGCSQENDQLLPSCSDGRVALCSSLGAKSLDDVDACGAGGRQPVRYDGGGQQHERGEDHG